MRAARRLILVLSVSALVLAGSPVPGVPVVAPASAEAAAPPGALYTPLATPMRILDTRTATGGHQRRVAPNETVALAVPGLPADATAVVVNLTGTGGTAATYLSLFPDSYAGTSTLNLEAGQTAAAGAFVALGADGRIRVLNRNGFVDVIVDLVGYLAPGPGVGFESAPATRILDTRSALGGHQRALAPGETMTLPVRAAAGVPADATAVLLNVTGVEPTATTYLRVTPDGRAGTSTLNLAPGVTRANVTVTAIGGDGAVRIANHVGNTHVLVDVLGWFGPSGQARYVPLTNPKRVLDTRTTPEGPLAAGTTRRADFAVADGVPRFGNVVTLFSLTGVQPTARTYLTAWRYDQPRPAVSTLNVEAGDTVPNTAVVEGTLANVYNNAGSANVLVDALGYFYAPTRPDPTVPGAPLIVSVQHDGTSASFYLRGSDDGGLPVTRYTATLQPGGRTVTVPVPGWNATARFEGLTVGTGYTLTVTATNLAGTGPSSAPRRIGPPPWMTRVDTTETGEFDADPLVALGGVSADGRYVLLGAGSDSVLVPAPHRTAGDDGYYQLRKDRQSGETEVVSVGADGRAVSSRWSALTPDNGTAVFTAATGIHVRDLATGDVRTVWPNAYGSSSLALSGDGRWVYWTVASSGRILYRHDLQENRTEAVLECADRATGCDISSGLEVSDDGATVVFLYRSAPGTPSRPTLLRPGTGELRTLTETDDARGLVLSGDGAWVYYVCDNCPAHTIRKLATAPGATPVTVRYWSNEYTMAVYPSSTSSDGRTLGYMRQRRDGYWFVAATGWVLDTVDGREAMLPQLRDNSYLQRPTLNADGGVAVAREDCKLNEDCEPTGIYALSVPDLLGGG